jgi:hypothetical protein
MTLEEAERLVDEECLAYTQACLTMKEAKVGVHQANELFQQAEHVARVHETRFLQARAAYLQLKLEKKIVTP